MTPNTHISKEGTSFYDDGWYMHRDKDKFRRALRQRKSLADHIVPNKWKGLY